MARIRYGLSVRVQLPDVPCTLGVDCDGFGNRIRAGRRKRQLNRQAGKWRRSAWTTRGFDSFRKSGRSEARSRPGELRRVGHFDIFPALCPLWACPLMPH